MSTVTRYSEFRRLLGEAQFAKITEQRAKALGVPTLAGILPTHRRAIVRRLLHESSAKKPRASRAPIQEPNETPKEKHE